MSNDATIEYRLSLVENATDTLIKNADQIQADLRAMQTSINQQFTNMQQDLHLIIEMYRTQQTQLAIIDSRLISIDHHNELLYRLVEQEIQKREGKDK